MYIPLSSFLSGFTFLTYILSRMLFLPTWVVAIAMVFLFCYDIIMVFITPFLTEVRVYSVDYMCFITCLCRTTAV